MFGHSLAPLAALIVVWLCRTLSCSALRNSKLAAIGLMKMYARRLAFQRRATIAFMLGMFPMLKRTNGNPTGYVRGRKGACLSASDSIPSLALARLCLPLSVARPRTAIAPRSPLGCSSWRCHHHSLTVWRRCLPAVIPAGPRMKNVNVEVMDDVANTIWSQTNKNTGSILREVCGVPATAVSTLDWTR